MSRPIRVLHVIKNFGLGGAETNLLNLIRATDPAVVEAHVAYSSGGEIAERFRKDGLRLFQYAPSDHKLKSVATLGIVHRLASYLRQQDIDIVHTHNFNGHVWGALAAKLAGKKLVEHVHDFRYLEWDEYVRRKGSASQFRFIRYFKRWSDRVVVLTHQNAEYLLSHGFYPSSRIREIRNGIPLVPRSYDTASVRRKLGLEEGSPVVLTPARMSAEKNIGLVLSIAPRVIQKVPNVRFLISGDGPLLASLKQEARDQGLEKNVLFTGYYPDIHELLSLTDVFLLPSFLELHSIAILEAMSMKVPVVASRDVGCNSEVFQDGQNGFLLDPFSIEGWAEVLVRLINDDDLRRAVGERSYELCRKDFDIQRVSEQFKGLYAELVRP